MKQILRKLSLIAVIALFVPVSLLAQNQKEKEEKDKEVKAKNDAEVITITRKGDKNEKVTVEINGDKVTVNGKPLEDYKNGDITVHRNKIRNNWVAGNGSWNFDNGAMSFFGGDENHAMLGVTTEKVEGGVEVQDVTKESAAEKIGLKEKDVITKIDDQKVEDPDDLSKAITKHKPGDKVKVTFLRDKKEQTATAELTKWKGVGVYSLGANNGFSYTIPDMKLNEMMPKIKTMPRMQQGDFGPLMNMYGGKPRLGLSVQDTDDGKGVKVLDVDDEGSAKKSGIMENDIVTEIDGKAVNSADEVAKIVRESKDKPSLMFKIQRGGKTQNIEVKIPRKLKTADL